MPRVAVTKNDLEALKAAYAGLRTTSARLLQMEPAIHALEGALTAGASPDGGIEPSADLIRAATAHAIAAAAFSGLLHRLFTQGGVAPTSPAELTDSAGESA